MDDNRTAERPPATLSSRHLLVIALSLLTAIAGCEDRSSDSRTFRPGRSDDTGRSGGDANGGADVGDDARATDAGSDAGNGSDGDEGGRDSGVPPTPTDVFAIQNPDSPAAIAPGTRVSLSGVIVTAIDDAPRGDRPESSGSFWVQEPEGGQHSGILVFNRGGDTVDATALALGDRVDLVGETTEFEGLTEIIVEQFTVTSAGEVPEPVAVGAADLATGGALAEAYEGVLVEVSNVVVSNPDIGFGKFELEGGLEVDDELLPTSPAVDAGDRFARIRGVMTWSFDARQLLPRSEADIVPEGGGGGALSIYDLQDPSRTGGPTPGDEVSLSGVIVTAVDRIGRGRDDFWVQEAEGGPYSGIFIFNPGPDSLDVTELSVGTIVDVTGTYLEFGDEGATDTLSEIEVESFSVVGEATELPTPVAIDDPSTLATDSTSAERWEGVLVSLGEVSVTEAPNEFGEFTVTGGVMVDDDLTNFDPAVTADTTFTSLTGVLDFSFGDFILLPRSNEDAPQR